MIARNLETRIKKLEASILPEVRPPEFVIIDGRQYGEDMDAAKESYFAAHPQDRGAPLVIFLRDIFGEKAAKKAKQET